ADGRTIVLKQTVVLLAEKGAQNSVLAGIASALPRVNGPQSQPPLLPTLFPAKGLVPGSMRYGLGPEGFSVGTGALANSSLGWEKSAEGARANYSDKRGDELLTMMLYPTPQIA